MRQIFLLFISLAIISCKNDAARNNTPPDEIPAPLREHNKSGSLVSKRGYSDLVSDLYEEHVKKSGELASLEKELDKVQNTEDSIEAYRNYNSRSNQYYSTANSLTGSIKDSALKSKIIERINKSMNAYNQVKLQHEKLINAINLDGARIADLHTILKIAVTLPDIENYQRKNLPPLSPLQHFRNNQQKALNKLDSMGKRNGG
jgi:hypothetical protein